MDKRIAGLLGAAAAFTVVSAAHATPVQTSQLAPATSYRDLLDPIPNAVPLLKADNAQLAQRSAEEVAQISVQLGHHHHHHHVVVRHHHHHVVVVHHHHHHHPHAAIVVH
ncbi:MAG: hypothetical protein WAM75_00655 [Xanthobacteraceae bacterium]